MKKIPTVFKREFENHKVVKVLPEFTNDECKDAFYNGIPTIKFDGSCCAVINGKFYKRYDAKKGRKIPENAIKCQDEPDPVTGHLPCWVPVDADNPADKHFWFAYMNHVAGTLPLEVPDGTYEAIGQHFNGNPYGFEYDSIIPHGTTWTTDFNPPADAYVEYTRRYLSNLQAEGIVFWLDDKPVCKIKRTDFGLPWPMKGGK